nr:MAG TPA: hypothetical protein [Bacteriophage sp.]
MGFLLYITPQGVETLNQKRQVRSRQHSGFFMRKNCDLV